MALTYDEQNRITAAYSTSYGYDHSGRLTSYEGSSQPVNTTFPAHAIKKSGYSYAPRGSRTATSLPVPGEPSTGTTKTAPRDSLTFVKPQFDENQDANQVGERKGSRPKREFFGQQRRVQLFLLCRDPRDVDKRG